MKSFAALLRRGIAGFVLASLGFCGLASVASARPWSPPPPPPPRFERHIVRPGWVWVPGHWRRVDGRWVWIRGHYRRR